jgi:glycosyltransferase involved in cell wall biosynthesis
MVCIYIILTITNKGLNNFPEHLREPLSTYMSQYKLVKIVRLNERQGLIRARLAGASNAKGPVLTYLDAHCECTEGWLEPLLDRIARNSTTVVCPLIDFIDGITFEYSSKSENGVRIGGFDWNLLVRPINVGCVICRCINVPSFSFIGSLYLNVRKIG